MFSSSKIVSLPCNFSLVEFTHLNSFNKISGKCRSTRVNLNIILYCTVALGQIDEKLYLKMHLLSTEDNADEERKLYCDMCWSTKNAKVLFFVVLLHSLSIITLPDPLFEYKKTRTFFSVQSFSIVNINCKRFDCCYYD